MFFLFFSLLFSLNPGIIVAMTLEEEAWQEAKREAEALGLTPSRRGHKQGGNRHDRKTLFATVDIETAIAFQMRANEEGKTRSQLLNELVTRFMVGWRSAYHVDSLRDQLKREDENEGRSVV